MPSKHLTEYNTHSGIMLYTSHAHSTLIMGVRRGGGKTGIFLLPWKLELRSKNF